MSTVNSLKAVIGLLLDNDTHPEEPKVVKVVAYRNDFDGGTSFGVVFEGQDRNRYEKSPAVHNPLTIWAVGDGVPVEEVRP